MRISGLKIENSSNNLHTCDKCHKIIEKWQVHQLVDRCYTPGENNFNVSSDITSHTQKFAEFCPDCMKEIRSIYSKESED